MSAQFKVNLLGNQVLGGAGSTIFKVWATLKKSIFLQRHPSVILARRLLKLLALVNKGGVDLEGKSSKSLL